MKSIGKVRTPCEIVQQRLNHSSRSASELLQLHGLRACYVHESNTAHMPLEQLLLCHGRRTATATKHGLEWLMLSVLEALQHQAF